MKTCSGWRRFLFFLPLVFFVPYLLSGNLFLSTSNYFVLESMIHLFAFGIFWEDNNWCLFSVLELHENSVVRDLPKKNRQKFDHLVFGPAAGQGLPNRLQCQGSCVVLVTDIRIFLVTLNLLCLRHGYQKSKSSYFSVI